MKTSDGIRILAIIAMTCAVAAASAQPYPSKVIRLLVPGSAGSGQDVLGRIVAPAMSQTLGQQIIVDNRPGASGTIGAEIASRAAPDGYTVLVINIAHALFAGTARNASYDLNRDFAPVTQLVGSPNLVVVHPSLPVKSVPELVKLARARPGAINYSSAGPGSSTFMAAEIFKSMTGVDIVHVPYNGGGPAVAAVVSGEVSVYFAPFATSLPHVRAGRLRALAVTTAERMPVTPELPTLAETGVRGYEFSNWYGLVVPAKAPAEVIATLNAAAASALKRADVRKSIGELGAIPVGSSPDAFGAYVRAQSAALAKIFKGKTLSE
jgi:tripartite-type tricarboxylate transporter receptor subunit TctC